MLSCSSDDTSVDVLTCRAQGFDIVCMQCLTFLTGMCLKFGPSEEEMWIESVPLFMCTSASFRGSGRVAIVICPTRC